MYWPGHWWSRLGIPECWQPHMPWQSVLLFYILLESTQHTPHTSWPPSQTSTNMVQTLFHHWVLTHTPICTSKLYNLLLKGILKKKVRSCTDHSFPEIATNMATWSIEYHKGIGWIFDLFLFKTMRAPECTIHLSPDRPQMLCKRELLWTGAGWNFWLQWWQIYVSSGGDNTMNNGHPLEKVGKWLSHIWLTK